MNRIWMMTMLLLLLLAGCMERSSGANRRTAGDFCNEIWSEGCWTEEAQQLQWQLTRWYAVNLDSPTPEREFRSAYPEILAGPDGVMGQIRFDRIDVTLPIFHEGSGKAGMIHSADSPFPTGERGTAVLRLSGEDNRLWAYFLGLEVGGRFHIRILAQETTYQVTQIATGAIEAGEGGCLLWLPCGDTWVAVAAEPTE